MEEIKVIILALGLIFIVYILAEVSGLVDWLQNKIYVKAKDHKGEPLKTESFPIELEDEGCPFCQEPIETFYMGPEGGTCINVQCSNCKAEFNLERVSGRAHIINGDNGNEQHKTEQ